MITVWSPKGGQGLSVTVAALALAHLRHDGASVAIVDLAGDQPAVLGVEGVGSVGVLDWLGSRASPQALGRTAIEVIDGLTLIPRGGGPPSVRPRPTDAPEVARPSRVVELWGAIDGLADLVLVDAGVPAPAPAIGDAIDGPTNVERRNGGSPAAAAHGVDALRLGYGADLSRQAVRAAATNIVVLRACYLALRRFGRLDLAADAIVFLREPRRALVAADLETTVGAPVVGTVEIDPAVARATDSGSLTSRLPRRLERQLVDVVPTARRAGSVFGGVT
jgi:hypothetical protein